MTFFILVEYPFSSTFQIFSSYCESSYCSSSIIFPLCFRLFLSLSLFFSLFLTITPHDSVYSLGTVLLVCVAGFGFKTLIHSIEFPSYQRHFSVWIQQMCVAYRRISILWIYSKEFILITLSCYSLDTGDPVSNMIPCSTILQVY